MADANHQRFPIWSYAPEQSIATAVIDGSEVGATAGSDGLDARGATFCNISKSGNTYTIAYKETWKQAPAVFIQPLTANGAANITTRSSSQLVFDSLERDDNTTAINDADFIIFFLFDRSDKAYN